MDHSDTSVIIPRTLDTAGGMWGDPPYPSSPVPAERVEECLCLYPRSQRHLVDFVYSPGRLSATLIPHNIDYSTITVEYYTACQLVMVASQMSYVLGGCTLLDPSSPMFPEGLYPTYMELLREGKLYYTDMSLRLRKKTSNHIRHVVSMSVVRVLHRNGLCVMVSRLLLPDRLGSIDVSTAMSTRRAL